MAIGYSTALAAAILDAVYNSGAAVAFYDAAIVEGRTGAKPSDPDQAPTGTLVFSITAPADAMNAAAARAVTKAGTWQDPSADATGTLGHYRVKKSGDLGTLNTTDRREDGTITVTGGGGDMEVDNTSVNSGQVVTITTWTRNLPA